MELLSLFLIVGVSIVIPVIVWIILLAKGKNQRIGIFLLFLVSAAFYVGVSWWLKQYILSYLFVNTGFENFMREHYALYMLVVALAGALLAVIPEWITVRLICRRKITYMQALAMGIGYCAAESTMLVGYKAVNTLIDIIKNGQKEIGQSTSDLLLTSLERFLLTIIGTGLIVIFIHWIEEKSDIKAVLFKAIAQGIIAFIPGFLVAFSTEDFLEVFDRSTTLIMVYIILGAAAFASFIVTDSLKWKMYEKR
ncbi:MAG: YhfC family intramembrane metalloprotease [Lachnospiraceae bacterium]|nr:YhfC family intramembrane metalloprotease [Lachnospiraceae bacterium]